MKFTVIWNPSAEQELAEIWEASLDRREVTRAANALDRRLIESADRAGESREGDDRIEFERPLGIRFRVSPSDRMVLVLNVWHTA